MTTIALLATLIGGFSGLVGLPTLLVLIRNSMRESRALAERPMQERLADMRSERDYWRDKADALELRLERRNRP